MSSSRNALLPYTDIKAVNGDVCAAFDQRAYLADQREIATADLLDHLEHLRYLAVEYVTAPQSRAVAEIWIGQLVDELARRQRLLARGDAISPSWPRKRLDIPARITAVKTAWPVEKMSTELLGCTLRRYGKDRFKARCPFHEERTPSFTVFTAEDRAWCFGCNQGGDVLELAGLYFNHHRFLDQLECLERFAGIAPPGSES